MLGNHLKIRCPNLRGEIGGHELATVGDSGGHHRHLERGGRDVELADGALRQLSVGEVFGEPRGDRRNVGVDNLAKPELLGLITDLVLA